MTQLAINRNLTVAETPQQRQQLIDTHEGMAHFAGSGPAGKTCRQCIFWADSGKRYASNPTGKTLKPARCRKFTALTGRLGGAVPHDALACRHFEFSGRPPEAEK